MSVLKVSVPEQPEVYSVTLIGAPLIRNSDQQQLTEADKEPDVSWMFEVRSDGGVRPPWTVRRDYEDMARFHQNLTNELPPQAQLPRLPERKERKKKNGFFRARNGDAEDQQLRDLGQKLAEYLNTLVKQPSTAGHIIVKLFLNFPQEAPAQPSASPSQIGEAAAESVTSSCAAICQGCRSFFAALVRPLSQPRGLLDGEAEEAEDTDPPRIRRSNSGTSLQPLSGFDSCDPSAISSAPPALFRSLSDAWVVDNSTLNATSLGLAVRHSCDLSDKDGDRYLPWGSLREGRECRLINADWLEVTGMVAVMGDVGTTWVKLDGVRYVPRKAQGHLVMRPHQAVGPDSALARLEGARRTGSFTGSLTSSLAGSLTSSLEGIKEGSFTSVDLDSTTGSFTSSFTNGDWKGNGQTIRPRREISLPIDGKLEEWK